MNVISTLHMHAPDMTLLVNFLMFASLVVLFDRTDGVEQLYLSLGLKCSYNYDVAVNTHHKKPDSNFRLNAKV